MKKDIHPQYYSNAKITCACGNVIEVGSTREKIDVEICGACHPFYTGKEKLIDTAGQVDRFKQRMEKMEALKKQKDQNKKSTQKAAKKGAKKSEKEKKESK